MSKSALGRGLGALLGGGSPAKAPVTASTTAPANPAAPAASSDPLREVPISSVHPCPFQPRKDFSEESLKELADSIREQGIVQPLIVRAQGEKFELIAGERRWRAAQLAGLKVLPVIVREADDRAVLEMALIENLQRENLNAIEEALGYSQLIESFRLTQDEASRKVGKSRAVVANSLRLLKLPPAVQHQIRTGALSVGHAKVLLGLELPDDQTRAAAKVVANALSVRQTEELVAQWQSRPQHAEHPAAPPAALRDPHVTDVENRLRERFGTKVHLKYRQGKGSLEVRFFSDDELERILSIVGVRTD